MAVHERIAAVCRHRGSQPMIIEAATGASMSGGELGKSVQAAASALVDAGVGPGDRVGICLDRSADLVAACLAVLSVGAAYVPLDPDFPPDRLRFMAADSGIKVLVADDAHAALLPGWHRIDIRHPHGGAGTAGRDDPYQVVAVARTVSPDDVAYVIYTSGSTGRPKGVVITHANLTAFLDAWDSVVDPGEPGVWLAATTFSFDPSVVELLWTLSRGLLAVLAPPDAAGLGRGESLAEVMVRFGVTHFQCTPSRARLLLDDPRERVGLAGLQHLLIGGEALSAPLAQRLLEAGVARLTNIYGPTETTVWSFAHEVDAAELCGPVPIGRPLPGILAEVVGPGGAAPGAGVIGELRIGGPGVARGYLGLPALTAERFVSDAVGSTRWYLTGDLASRADDGTFSFHGRGDQQVKLNGFRIELGELESTLELHPAVAQCVAAVVDDARGEPCLVAWCVPAAGAALDVVALRSLAAERLPEAMVPRTVAAVSGFVLTPTGKADRSRLRYPSAEAVAAPPTADQRADDLDALVADFSTVVERAVRPDDDFFDLGGHSLSAAWLATLIFDRTGLRMPLRAVVESPTPRLLARRLDALSQDVDGIGSGAQVLVRFGRRRAVPQLYVVHGAGGNVIGFHDLAESLADVADVIGVQAIGVEPGNSLDETVEAMAARYVEAIRADRADHGSLPGPVLLGGYSGGGRVALCMAAQLLHEGVEVGSVALIDTFVSEHLPSTLAGRVAAVMASARDRGPHTRRQWARSSFAAWRRRREADVPVDSPEQVARYVDLEEAIDRATMAAPPPQPVSCGAFLIRAQYTNPVFRLDYRWDPHLHAAVPVAWVPGGHLTLLQRPAVDHVANAIRNGMRTWLSGSPHGTVVTQR